MAHPVFLTGGRPDFFILAHLTGGENGSRERTLKFGHLGIPRLPSTRHGRRLVGGKCRHGMGQGSVWRGRVGQSSRAQWGQGTVGAERGGVGLRRSALSKLVSDFLSFYLPSSLLLAYKLFRPKVGQGSREKQEISQKGEGKTWKG